MTRMPMGNLKYHLVAFVTVAKRADLEIDTVEDVFRILKAEFESDDE